jgi:ubiquinone/menaquinone biosynthesis C-methylase UbiE
MDDLEKIFKKFNCDKHFHGYHNVYSEYLQSKRNDELNILEIGVLNGSSLNAWLEYLPNSKIYAVDTFERVNSDEIDILNHERVTWFEGDSTRINLPDLCDVQFDFIIDDGLHTSNSQRRTFNNLFRMLKPEGFYIIEDVYASRLITNRQQEKIELNLKNWFDRNCSVSEYDSLIETLRTFGSSLEIFNLNRLSKIQKANSCLLIIGK